MNRRLEQLATGVSRERKALSERIKKLDAALSALHELGYDVEAEVKVKSVKSKPASPSLVTQSKRLRRFTNTRWRQKLQAGQDDYITNKRRRLRRHTCLQCSKGFLGVKTARFHSKKCADNYYTKHYRATGKRVGKATHPNASKTSQDAPGSAIGNASMTDTGFKYKSDAKPARSLKRHYTSTQEERRLIAQRAGLVAAQNRRERLRAAIKEAKKGVTLLPGDPIHVKET